MLDFPGSHKSRERARRLLTAQQIKPSIWLVTGGELGHGVIVNPDGTYTCDCGRQAGCKGGWCSHAMAVDMQMRPTWWRDLYAQVPEYGQPTPPHPWEANNALG